VAALVAAAVSLTLAGSACMHAPDRAEGYGTRAPRRTPSVDEVPVHGYQARLRFLDGGRLRGELLIAEPGPEGIVVVRTRKHGDQTRASADLRRAAIRTDPKRDAWLGGVGGMTAVMLPLTILTGGYILVFAPIVAAGGAVALGIIAAESRVVLRDDELMYLYQYARWPQGRPRAD
jgi:hypothetical protein